MVQEVAASETPLTATYITNSGFTWRGKDPNRTEEFVTVCVTHEFGKTAGWQIVQGRDFRKDFASDSVGLIINEAAAKYLGLANPVGETMKWNGHGDWKIIGVIKDLVTQSPFEPAKQTLFLLDYDRISFVDIRINPKISMHKAMATIQAVYKKYDTENPFEYNFVDDE
jgi:hypothetical protein